MTHCSESFQAVPARSDDKLKLDVS
jgi:hypothetical protein